MMAVITDDFTGASEIGGIALSKGYRVVIETKSVENHDTDILIIASDMRSLEPAEAAAKSAMLTKQILTLNPDLIYKKVDSVLRGNIGPELEAQMKEEGKSQSLLIPANPSLQRTIENGVYLVNKAPLSRSGFSKSESGSSNVVDILKDRGATQVNCIALHDAISSTGVTVGNTKDAADLSAWAAKINGQTVPAGAAGFFAAILETRQPEKNIGDYKQCVGADSKILYICGSKFPSSRQAVSVAKDLGACVMEVPDEIYYNKQYDTEVLDNLTRNIADAFTSHNRVVVSAMQTPGATSLGGSELTEVMAKITTYVVDNVALDELMIEGGATSQALMGALGVDKLYPVQSLSFGVTRMRVNRHEDLHVTMKPGSYSWPESIWKFTNLEED